MVAKSHRACRGAGGGRKGRAADAYTELVQDDLSKQCSTIMYSCKATEPSEPSVGQRRWQPAKASVE